MNGVLVVDKPRGPTSHDVVARARRALRTRSVGHAGTLDPMATGALVLAVGEGTKLVQHLTANDKVYEATIVLGVETDTLDADGETTRRAPLSRAPSHQEVERAARELVGRIEQRVPAFSAVKVGGERLHERARRGEGVEAPVREVVVHALEVLEVAPEAVRVRVECGKGFYVRALARDLAAGLGTVGHLMALRRTRSGTLEAGDAVAYDVLEGAASGDGEAREALASAMLSLEQACAGMPRVQLDERATEDARHGRRIDLQRLPDTRAKPAGLGEERTLALLGPDGRLVALGRREGDRLRVVRGFHGE